MARKTTSQGISAQSVPPRIRRSYFDCRYGQLHVHHAIPASGGFDEATALLCLPGAPGSGRFFLPCLTVLGMDRSVFAPDLPGCGESDPLGDEPVTSHALAVAMADFLQSMRLRRVDLLAHGDGVAVASALLALNADAIGRIVVSAGDPDGIPGRPVRRIDLDDSGAVTGPQLDDLKGFLGIN